MNMNNEEIRLPGDYPTGDPKHKKHNKNEMFWSEKQWPELYQDTGYIQLDNGEVMIRRFGKYQPDLCFILNPKNKEVKWNDSTPSGLNIEIDASSIQWLPGDYWVSKKGSNCFRPSISGKHMLLSCGWGGCFDDTRGYEYNSVTDALYKTRKTSNNRGTGYNYYIFPIDYHRTVSIDDI